MPARGGLTPAAWSDVMWCGVQATNERAGSPARQPAPPPPHQGHHHTTPPSSLYSVRFSPFALATGGPIPSPMSHLADGSLRIPSHSTSAAVLPRVPRLPSPSASALPS
ncbi:hypothetical protein PR202_ga13579 [Eleusine coracana subsp. coracana]|uniref:Uncharacterized protein n=1 Tax=Eleusine coracana subsp. coracana TaxID=191504 RepID=A0AAV5CF34_ELECO|nr:hypothetical protein PR202_ga13579 [Eleusine coracana subsp. coracana]